MLNFDQRGAGEHTILLLHGFLGSGRNLMSLAKRWSDKEPRLRLVFPDLTAHGLSPTPANPTIENVARDLFALAEDINADEPLTIVGHSFGGRTALQMRLQQPERVGQVVLLDITPSPLAPGLGGLDNVIKQVIDAPATATAREPMRAYFAEKGISPGLTDWVLMNLTQDQGTFKWRFDRQALKHLNESSRGHDLWSAVAAGKTTLIYGEKSSFVTPQDVERARSAGVDIHSIADAGHFLHVDAQGPLLDCLVALDL
jgi:esterase